MSNSLKALLSAYVLLQASLSLAHAQSNIVFNGGFELGATGWETNAGTWVLRTLLVPEGSNILYQGTVAQTLNTVAGRDYILQFAYRTTCPTNITWGGKPVTGFTNLAYSTQWYWVYTYLRAETDLTRLSIGGGNIDDIRVGWLQEPVSILVQPQSLALTKGAPPASRSLPKAVRPSPISGCSMMSPSSKPQTRL